MVKLIGRAEWNALTYGPDWETRRGAIATYPIGGAPDVDYSYDSAETWLREEPVPIVQSTYAELLNMPREEYDRWTKPTWRLAGPSGEEAAEALRHFNKATMVSGADLGWTSIIVSEKPSRVEWQRLNWRTGLLSLALSVLCANVLMALAYFANGQLASNVWPLIGIAGALLALHGWRSAKGGR